MSYAPGILCEGHSSPSAAFGTSRQPVSNFWEFDWLPGGALPAPGTLLVAGCLRTSTRRGIRGSPGGVDQHYDCRYPVLLPVAAASRPTAANRAVQARGIAEKYRSSRMLR